MHWLISDIHGQMDDFLNLLSKIQFDRTKDKIIIMGDIIDRGPKGIELLKYIRPFVADGSMKLLIGNHEMFMLMYLMGQLDHEKWIHFGGEETYEILKTLSPQERSDLQNFLEGCPHFCDAKSSRYGNVIVTHTGIDPFYLVEKSDGKIDVKASINSAIKNNYYYYMVGTGIHGISDSVLNKFDHFVFVGHVPCFRLNSDLSNSFYRTDYYMDIDSGAGHKDQGGCLGCYCLDTDMEVYCD